MDDIITYLVLTCNDETSISAAKRVTQRKGLQAIVTFILKFRRVNVITST